MPNTDKSGILRIMCTMNQDLFIDSATGKCNFTGEEFKKILEFANRFPKEVEYDPNAPGAMEKIRNGGTAFNKGFCNFGAAIFSCTSISSGNR